MPKFEVTYNTQYTYGDVVRVQNRQSPYRVVSIIPLDLNGNFQYHLEPLMDYEPELTVSECLIVGKFEQ